MESIEANPKLRRRPGGRTAETTARVNAAVLELLAEKGIASCTIPAVAARAQVERSTLYRRYSDRWAMIIDAIADMAQGVVTSSDQGSFKADLSKVLAKLAQVLDSPVGPAAMMVAAAIKDGAAAEYADRYWSARALQLQPMFDAAIARGELRKDVDPEQLFAMAAGPVYFRTFISRRPVDQAFIDQVVESVLDAYAT